MISIANARAQVRERMTKETAASLSVHLFSMRVAGAGDVDDRPEDVIYRGGVNGALLSVSGAKLLLDFDREGDSFVAAVQSAMLDVERRAAWRRNEALRLANATYASRSRRL